jgi:hypothetical protein
VALLVVQVELILGLQRGDPLAGMDLAGQSAQQRGLFDVTNNALLGLYSRHDD